MEITSVREQGTETQIEVEPPQPEPIAPSVPYHAFELLPIGMGDMITGIALITDKPLSSLDTVLTAPGARNFSVPVHLVLLKEEKNKFVYQVAELQTQWFNLFHDAYDHIQLPEELPGKAYYLVLYLSDEERLSLAGKPRFVNPIFDPPCEKIWHLDKNYKHYKGPLPHVIDGISWEAGVTGLDIKLGPDPDHLYDRLHLDYDTMLAVEVITGIPCYFPMYMNELAVARAACMITLTGLDDLESIAEEQV
jgi:hypothetical protein